MKPKRSWVVAWLMLSAAVGRAEVVNRIVASVDGEPITLYELRQYEAKQRAVMPNAPEASQNDMLQALITEKLLAREIAARGIQVRDQDVDRYIDHIKETNRVDEEQLKAALQQQGMDYEKYRAQVRGEIEKVQLLNREIRGKVTVSPQDVDRYYQAHKKDYEVPGKVHVRQITLRLEADAPGEVVQAVVERARAVKARLAEGEDFAKVAQQVSEDPVAADGGDLGEVEPAKLLPEFESAVGRMKDGEVSEPIRTKMGVHLLKLEQRIDVAHRPQEEVAAEIKEKLYNDALDERYKRWLLEDIQKRHFVEIKL
ncbi:MAG: peptidylprolyl isomerase [Deltaproteobacteria bacterium]|nr:peptidylprolyl isomerase [Deltaproteobacteria bacterium]